MTAKRPSIVLLAMIGIGLGVLHAYFPLRYVFDVMVDQEPDFDDFLTAPVSVIEPADEPGLLPVTFDDRVLGLLESHPEIDNAATFLRSTETTAFLVVHDGRLIFEQYGLGNEVDSIQNTFSVSKSITSALIGLATDDGFLEIDDSITEYLPELGRRDQRFARITIRNLLDMKSGIAYSREIAFPIINNDDPLIYYHPDLESVVLQRTQIESAPGSFKYNNYNTPLLGLILRRATGKSASEYLERRFWRPIGAVWPAGWITDEQGFERMESGFHARARDLARFGLLYLNEGRIGDQQVISREWIQYSTDAPEDDVSEEYNGRRWKYRAGWWIVPRRVGRPDYCAIGRSGQFVYISPQFSTVFIRNGPGRGEWGDRDWTGLFYLLAERIDGISDVEP